MVGDMNGRRDCLARHNGSVPCDGEHDPFVTLARAVDPSESVAFAIGVGKHAGHAGHVEVARERAYRRRIGRLKRPQTQPLRSNLHGKTANKCKRARNMTGAPVLAFESSEAGSLKRLRPA